MKEQKALPDFTELYEEIQKVAALPLTRVKTAQAEIENIKALQSNAEAEVAKIAGELAALQPAGYGVDAGKLFLKKRRALEAALADRKGDLADIDATLLPLNEAELAAAKEAARPPVAGILYQGKEIWQARIHAHLQEIDSCYHTWLEISAKISHSPELKGILGPGELGNVGMLKTRFEHEAARTDLIYK